MVSSTLLNTNSNDKSKIVNTSILSGVNKPPPLLSTNQGNVLNTLSNNNQHDLTNIQHLQNNNITPSVHNNSIFDSKSSNDTIDKITNTNLSLNSNSSSFLMTQHNKYLSQSATSSPSTILTTNSVTASVTNSQYSVYLETDPYHTGSAIGSNGINTISTNSPSNSVSPVPASGVNSLQTQLAFPSGQQLREIDFRIESFWNPSPSCKSALTSLTTDWVDSIYNGNPPPSACSGYLTVSTVDKTITWDSTTNTATINIAQSSYNSAFDFYSTGNTYGKVVGIDFAIEYYTGSFGINAWYNIPTLTMVQADPTPVTTDPSTTYYPAYFYQGHDYFGPNHNSFTLGFYSSEDFIDSYIYPWYVQQDFIYVTITNLNTNSVVFSNYIEWPYQNSGNPATVYTISFALPNPSVVLWNGGSWGQGNLPISANIPYKIVLKIVDMNWNFNTFTIYPFYYTQNPSISQSSVINGGGLTPNINNWYNSNNAIGKITVSLPSNSPGIGSVSYTVGGSSSGTTVNNPSSLVYQTQVMSNWYSSSTSNTNIVWSVIDNVGNKISYTQNFGLDLDNPVINNAFFNSPLVNGYYTSTSIYSTITVTDTGGSHINTISYEVLQGTTVISNNGQWTTVTPSSTDSYSISTLSISQYTTATSGSFSITVLTQDNAGNSVSSTSTFNIDTIIPSGIYSTSYSSWQSNNQLSYQISIPCPFSGMSSFSITDNNGSPLTTSSSSTPYLTSTPSYSCSTGIFSFAIANLYQGNNTIAVIGTSGAGFTSTPITTLTQVDISIPIFGSNTTILPVYTDNTSFLLKVNATDPISGIKNVSIYADGIQVYSSTITPLVYVYTNINEGIHNITYLAYTNANKYFSKQILFNIDITPPALSLLTPSNSSWILSTQSIQISNTDNYSGILQTFYHWDDQTSNISLTNSMVPTITQGSHYCHYLYIYSEDKAGNWATLILMYNIDDTAPIISEITFVTIPYVKSSQLVYFNITDNNGVGGSQYEYYWSTSGIYDPNAYLWLSVTGLVKISMPTTVDGDIYLTIQSKDILSNGRSVVFHFIVDNTAPTLISYSPSNDTYVRSNSNILISFNDLGVNGTIYAFLWDNNVLSSYQTIQSITVPVGNGQHRLYVSVKDALGNTALYTFIFITDDYTNAPTIISPGTNTVGQTITLSANYDSSVVKIQWSISSSTNTLFLTSNTFDTTTVSDGQYVLTITVTDVLGDKNSTSKLITIFNAVPNINIQSITPTNNTLTYGNVSVFANATSITSINFYYLLKGSNSAYTLLVNQTTPIKFYWNTALLNGTYILKIVATNSNAGKSSVVYVYFTLYNAPTAITMFSPTNGQTLGNNTVIFYYNAPSVVTTISLYYWYDTNNNGYPDEINGTWIYATSTTSKTIFYWISSSISYAQIIVKLDITNIANINSTQSFIIVIDNVPPKVSSLSPDPNNNLTGMVSFSVTLTKTSTYSVSYHLMNQNQNTIFTNGVSNFIYFQLNTTKILITGTLVITISVVDSLGNKAIYSFDYTVFNGYIYLKISTNTNINYYPNIINATELVQTNLNLQNISLKAHLLTNSSQTIYPVIFTCQSSLCSVSWSDLSLLPNTSLTLVFYAQYKTFNYYTQVLITLYIHDYTPPTITFIPHSPNSTLNLGESLQLQWTSEDISNITQESVDYSANGFFWTPADVSNVYNTTWQSFIPYLFSWQNGTVVSYKITATDIYGNKYIYKGSILYLDKAGPSVTLYYFVNGDTLYITGNITSYVGVKSVLLVFETSSSNSTWSTIQIPFNLNSQSFSNITGSFVYTMNIGTNSSIQFYLLATDSLGVSHLYYQGNDIPGSTSQQNTIAQNYPFMIDFSANSSSNNSSSKSSNSGGSIDFSLIAAGILGLLIMVSIGMIRKRRSLKPRG